MDKGTIIFYKKFRFSDGEGGEKLLIILNTFKDLSIPYLCCKTTSKQKYNLINPGCYSDRNIYINQVHKKIPRHNELSIVFIVLKYSCAIRDSS